MFNFNAIGLHNGWAMAAVGAMIVFSGLVVLSTAISLLPKLLKLWDNRSKIINYWAEAKGKSSDAEQGGPASADQNHLDVNTAVKLYRDLTKNMEEPFMLSELYALCQQNSFPHPHLTITRLREANALVPHEDGRFFWK